MTGSLKIGRIAGIGIYVHWTFALLIGYVLMLHLGAGETMTIAFKGLALVLAMFGCVVLHELGHALAARRYGIFTRDITMLPIGGVARLERIPREPRQELVVAVAGPAVNVVIAAVLLLGLTAFYGAVPAGQPMDPHGNIWAQLMKTNVYIVLFNLVPAFPMDGGRILRALLALRLEYTRATRIAARLGQILAICFGVMALAKTEILWLFIAVFVFMGAEAESQMVQTTSTFRGVPVRQAMMTKFRALAPTDTLATAATELLAGSQQDFPITTPYGGSVLGILTRQDLVKGLTQRGATATVGEVMRPNCPVVSENEMIERSYDILRQNNCSSLPVVRDGQLVGLITLENITEWIMLNNALRTPRPRT